MLRGVTILPSIYFHRGQLMGETVATQTDSALRASLFLLLNSIRGAKLCFKYLRISIELKWPNDQNTFIGAIPIPKLYLNRLYECLAEK